MTTGQSLLPLDAADAPLVQLRLRRHQPLRVALERALRSLPISPGQRTVCRALYHGQAQQGIADSLGVAPTTVVGHLRKAYRALDLHSVLDSRTLPAQRMGRAGHCAARAVNCAASTPSGCGKADSSVPGAQLLQQAVQLIERAEADRHLTLFTPAAATLDADVHRRRQRVGQLLFEPQDVA